MYINAGDAMARGGSFRAHGVKTRIAN